MLGERTRRSSGFVEVAEPEARRLDKLAWSRRCAMLMGSACPWKLEHICLTSWSGQDVLTILRSHLTTKMMDLAPTLSRLQLEEGSLAATTAAAALSQSGAPSNHQPAWLWRASQKSWGLPIESHLQRYEMIDPTPDLPQGGL
jgi:hypothetical protein